MTEWKKYKLGDIGQIRMCKRILKEETNPIGGIPFYKISTFGQMADVYISPDTYLRYKKLYAFPKKGEVLISAAGTIGRTVIYNGEDAYFQDSNIVWIENDETKVLNEYLYYCYQNIQWKISNGSTILRLYNDDIRNTQISVPDLPTQKRIASVLSNIDRKIALNRAMNEELEQTARDLYDYWFLQFDFPDANGKPYRSSGGKMIYNPQLKREIPEGWEVEKLKDILDIEDSKRVPLSSKVRSQMQGKYPYYGATGILDYVDDYIFDGEYILLAEDGSTSTVNGKCVTQFIWGKSWVNNHAHILVPKMTNTLSYHFLMLQQIPAKLIETGSIQKKISQENLMRYNVQVPQQELILKFCAMINSIKEQYKINTESIDHLCSLRDELLPLLMNGQVKVKE